MKKIGITGSLASGKTTASKILSFRKGPLFSADKIVKKLYKNKDFKKVLIKKLKIKNNSNLKKILRKKILSDKSYLNKLEKLIHPLVRAQMKNFIKRNKTKKFVFFEIPLLIESKLFRKFDIIIFIRAKKSLRLKRFKSKGGNKRLFDVLDKKQLSDQNKMKYCDHVVVNNKNLVILKKNLLYILSKYE
tara:strand:+ start:151 stop:717 length:567 start_codon:yes stop_codon:yes gene_type:complete